MILNYQADIWAPDMEKSAGLMSEVLFYVMDNPGLVTQPKGFNNPITNYLMVAEIIDNSDISMEVTRGRLTRYTIMIQLQCHIAKLEDKDRIYIRPEYYTFDGSSIE